MPEYKNRDEALANTKPEEIIKAYTGGRLQNTLFNKLLVEKAVFENRKAFGDEGYMMALYRKTVKEMNEGWDKIKESIAEAEEIDKARKAGDTSFDDMSTYQQLKSDVMRAGQQLWGMAQIANAIPTALGAVNGLAAERIALQNGASISTAAHLRVAADFTSNIIPAARATQATVGGIKVATAIGQGIGKKLFKEGVQAELKYGEGEAVKLMARSIYEETSGQLILRKGEKGASIYEGMVTPKNVLEEHATGQQIMQKGAGASDYAGTMAAKKPFRAHAEYEGPVEPARQTIEEASKAGQLHMPGMPDPSPTRAGQASLPLKAGGEGPGLPVEPGKPFKAHAEYTPGEDTGAAIAQSMEEASKSGQLSMKELLPDPGPMKAGQTALPLKAGGEGPGLPVAPADPSKQAIVMALQEGLAAEGIESKLIAEGTRIASKAAKTAGEETAVKKAPKYMITDAGNIIDINTGQVMPRRSVSAMSLIESGELVPSRVLAPRVWTGTAQKMAKDMGVPPEHFPHLMAGWEPASVASGKIDDAAKVFVEQMADLDPEKMAGMKVIMSRMVNDTGSFTPEHIANAYSDAATLYRNILLFNPAGRTRDLISNMGSTLNYMAQRQAGVLIGESGETTTRGTIAYARGLVAALDEGFSAFKGAFTPQGLMEGSSRFDKPIEEVAGRMGINVPTSFTVGIDRFFKTINRRAYLYAAEMERAVKTGTAFDIANVNMPGKELMAAAEQHAGYVTFQNDLGKIGNTLAGLSRTPLTELYFPFMKTPINLLKYGWNNTPGLQVLSGRLWKELAAGGPAADAAMGRLMMSNMFGFYVAELAKADLITGSGPANETARAAWLKTHKPYSIRVGDEWIGLNFASPLHQVVGMVANMTQIMPEFKDNPAAIEKMGLAVMMSAYGVVGEEGWWKQVSDLGTAVKGLTGATGSDLQVHAALRLLAQPAISTFSSGPVAMVKNLIDPALRDGVSVIEHFQALTPVWGMGVPPRTDDYGNDAIPERALGGRWAAPFSPVKIKDIPVEDRVIMEGSRVGAKAPHFARNIGGSPHEWDLDALEEGDHAGVGLTLQQEYELKKYYHDYLYHPELGIPFTVAQDEYKKGTNVYQKLQFEGTMRDAKTDAEDKMLIKYPELGIKLLQNQARQDLGLFQPNDPNRYPIQGAYAEAISFYENLTPEEQNNILRFTTQEERR